MSPSGDSNDTCARRFVYLHRDLWQAFCSDCWRSISVDGRWRSAPQSCWRLREMAGSFGTRLVAGVVRIYQAGPWESAWIAVLDNRRSSPSGAPHNARPSRQLGGAPNRREVAIPCSSRVLEPGGLDSFLPRSWRRVASGGSWTVLSDTYISLASCLVSDPRARAAMSPASRGLRP
jgi:hypothetical protein